jgi:Ni,Fe-hydrogenase III small subunit/NAD-dependent dihydropyrimidine dehydrogenase PreA subunit
MISDIVRRSLEAPSRLIPVEELSGSSAGSRMPEILPERLTVEIAERIVAVCPTAALKLAPHGERLDLVLDYGECIGCGRCVSVGEGAVVAASHLQCCGVSRVGLVRSWDAKTGTEQVSPDSSERVRTDIFGMLGRALNIRQLDPGSCNGCEAEIVALTNPYYDLDRFGIHFVASPKHADMLLVTGPVTRNMAEAVKKTYEAVPQPKLVVAVGACGCGGGLFAASPAVVGGVDALLPVDGYIPGCPPTPAMLVTGILEVLRRCSGKGRPRDERKAAQAHTR